jgi:hypothetical protein
MTTEPLGSRSMVTRLAGLRAELALRPDIEPGPGGQPILDPAAGEDTGGPGPGAPGGSGSPDVLRPSSVSRRTLR